MNDLAVADEQRPAAFDHTRLRRPLRAVHLAERERKHSTKAFRRTCDRCDPKLLRGSLALWPFPSACVFRRSMPDCLFSPSPAGDRIFADTLGVATRVALKSIGRLRNSCVCGWLDAPRRVGRRLPALAVGGRSSLRFGKQRWDDVRAGRHRRVKASAPRRFWSSCLDVYDISHSPRTIRGGRAPPAH